PCRRVVLLLPQAPERGDAVVEPCVAVRLVHPVGAALEPDAAAAVRRPGGGPRRCAPRTQVAEQEPGASALLTDDDRPQSPADVAIDPPEVPGSRLGAQPEVAVPAAQVAIQSVHALAQRPAPRPGRQLPNTVVDT